jgi:hypothetical protein
MVEFCEHGNGPFSAMKAGNSLARGVTISFRKIILLEFVTVRNSEAIEGQRIAQYLVILLWTKQRIPWLPYRIGEN